MSTDIAKIPEVQAALVQIDQLEGKYVTYAVTTAEEFTHSADELKLIKGAAAALEAEADKIIKPAHAAWKAAIAFFKTPKSRLAALEAKIKGALKIFSDEQKRLADEARRKAAEEAEKERRRLQAIADEAREREAAVQRQRDLEAKQQRDAAAAEQRRLDEAARVAREAGDREAAEAAEQERLRVQAANEATERERQRQATEAAARVESKAETFETRAAATVAPAIVPETPKAKGISTRDNWVYEITDPKQINPDFLIPDTKKIGQTVKALKADAAKIIGEGIRVRNDSTIAVRA